MNEKLLKLFRAIRNQNFITTFEFQEIYNNATQEDKDAFIAWTNDNGLKIIDGRSRGMYLFSKIDKEGWLSPEELRETMYISEDETLEEEPQKIFFEELEHIYCTKFDSDYPCGWLDLKGELNECDWGDHELVAGEYIRENELLKEQDIFEKEYGTHYCKDFLIYKGWVLLDCPSGNCQTVITFRKGRLSKKQKDYLVDYLLRIEDSVSMEALI